MVVNWKYFPCRIGGTKKSARQQNAFYKFAHQPRYVRERRAVSSDGADQPGVYQGGRQRRSTLANEPRWAGDDRRRLLAERRTRLRARSCGSGTSRHVAGEERKRLCGRNSGLGI